MGLTASGLSHPLPLPLLPCSPLSPQEPVDLEHPFGQGSARLQDSSQPHTRPPRLSLQRPRAPLLTVPAVGVCTELQGVEGAGFFCRVFRQLLRFRDLQAPCQGKESLTGSCRRRGGRFVGLAGGRDCSCWQGTWWMERPQYPQGQGAGVQG